MFLFLLIIIIIIITSPLLVKLEIQYLGFRGLKFIIRDDPRYVINYEAGFEEILYNSS